MAVILARLYRSHIFHLQEEEDYATFLGNEFFLGLSEINEGTTKRAFLSSKLVCTKMRISKKFKGKLFHAAFTSTSGWCCSSSLDGQRCNSYLGQTSGKEVFTRKAFRPDGLEFSLRDVQNYKQRHVDLEKKFIRAVLLAVIKSGVKVRDDVFLDQV